MVRGTCKNCEYEDTPLTPSGECHSCERIGKPNNYTEEQRGNFVYIESGYKDLIPTFVCLGCKGDRFIVGRSSYTTAIKCPSCGWEAIVHDG